MHISFGSVLRSVRARRPRRPCRRPAAEDMSDHRKLPRQKSVKDAKLLDEVCRKHALSIVRFEPQTDVEETVRLNMEFLVALAGVTTRVPAPLLAKTVKKHVPEFGPAERTAWANAMKQAATYCAKHNSRETKKAPPR